MDKYVKRIKRQSNCASEEPCAWTASSTKLKDAQDFYFPDSSRSDGSTNMISDDDITDHPIVPGAPQKSCEPDLATMTLPEMNVYWTKRTGQPNHHCVTRRLMFDDEIKTDDKGKKRKDMVGMVNNHVDSGNKEMITLFEEKMTSTAAAKHARFRSVVESISGRGFAVTKVIERPPQSGCSSAGTTAQACTGTEEEDSAFECVSIFEGMAYCVQVSATADRDKSACAVAAASTLSAVGPHPNIVAFHSSWSDARFHYVQMELCPENLWSRSGRYRLNSAADYRTVLEHVACALHYLHVCKGYAHNQVNGGNVYPVADGDHVVYKLGGFDGATRLSHVDAARASFADVKSLCSTVSLLMEERGDGDDEDLLALRSYLSYVTRKIDSASDTVGWTTATDVNAFAVWRWCCAARHQQEQRPRQGRMPVVYGNGSSENDVGLMETAEAIPDGPPQQTGAWRM